MLQLSCNHEVTIVKRKVDLQCVAEEKKHLRRKEPRALGDLGDLLNQSSHHLGWKIDFLLYTHWYLLNFIFFKVKFIHERHRQREKQASSGEPYAGLDPGTPGSCPESKADAQPVSHPGVPS